MMESKKVGVYDRIELVAEYYGKSLRQVSIMLGLPSPQVFYDIKSGKVRKVSEKILEKVKENLPENNTSWLVTGEGDKLKNPNVGKIPL